MLRVGLVVVIAVLMCLNFGTGSVYAQDSEKDSRLGERLKVSLGVMLGDNDRLRDGGGNTWFALGVSYDLKRPFPTRLIDFAAYFEGAANSVSSKLESQPRRAFTRSFFGIGVRSQIRLTPPARHFGSYGTAGVGFYNIRRNTSDSYEYSDYIGNYDDDPQGYTVTRDSRNKFSLGYRVGAGFRFGKRFFVETNYYNLGKLEDIRYSGLGIVLGSRL